MNIEANIIDRDDNGCCRVTKTSYSVPDPGKSCVQYRISRLYMEWLKKNSRAWDEVPNVLLLHPKMFDELMYSLNAYGLLCAVDASGSGERSYYGMAIREVSGRDIPGDYIAVGKVTS